MAKNRTIMAINSKAQMLKKRPNEKAPSVFTARPLPHLDLKKAAGEEPRQPEYHESSLINWLRWYFFKRVRGGTKSRHTESAKFNDLQKFVNFYYDRRPSGDIKRWNNELSKSFTEDLRKLKYAQATIARIVASISHFGTALKDWKCLSFDPEVIKAFDATITEETAPETLLLLKGRTVLAEGEIVFKLLVTVAEQIARGNADKKKRPFRDVAILYFLYYTGVRAEELCNIDIAQMKPHPKTAGAEFSNVKGKRGFLRTVYLRNIALTKLYRYFDKERKGEDPGPLFQSSRKGNRLQRQNIWTIVNDIRKKTEMLLKDGLVGPAEWKGAKIKVHPHTFRHERSYKLLKNLSESQAAEEIGHKSTRQLKRYVKRSKDARFEKLKNI